MNSSGENNELTDKLAVALSRLHQLLLAEKEAVRGLDRERMDQLEAEIAQVLAERNSLLDQLRSRITEHGS
jgi:hypothetical protein